MSTNGMPPQDEPERQERWGPVITLLLPAIKGARKHVGMTEATFRTNTFHGLPRPFFHWTALDEVLKACLFLMKLDGFLSDEEPRRTRPDDADPTDRAIEAMLLEEGRLRARRLCELLAQLVLFAQRDSPDLYRHFLLLEELVRTAGYNQDISEFHGVGSKWVNATIEMTIAEIQSLEPRIDPNDAWYARLYPRPIRVEAWSRLLSSTRRRLIRALPLMTDLERLTLGTTYEEAFGAPSGTIHYRAGADPVDHSRESSVVAEASKLGLTGLCVMRRIHYAIGEPGVEQGCNRSQIRVTGPKSWDSGWGSAA